MEIRDLGYPRRRVEFMLTDEELGEFLKKLQARPVMLVGGFDIGRSVQEAANEVWKELGDRAGFEWDTVQPVEGKGHRWFTAVLKDTEEEKKCRVRDEKRMQLTAAIEGMRNEVVRLGGEILKLEMELSETDGKGAVK